MLTSPLAKGLFQPVAAHSGFTGTGPDGPPRSQTLREAEGLGIRLGLKIGAPTLAALLAKPARELLGASDRQLRPIIDGYIAPEDVYAVFAAGKQVKLPVLLGSNSNERGNYPRPRSMREYVDYTRRQYPDAVEEVMNIFPAGNDQDAMQAYLTRERDRMAAGMRRWAKVTTGRRLAAAEGAGPGQRFLPHHTPGV